MVLGSYEAPDEATAAVLPVALFETAGRRGDRLIRIVVDRGPLALLVKGPERLVGDGVLLVAADNLFAPDTGPHVVNPDAVTRIASAAAPLAMAMTHRAGPK